VKILIEVEAPCLDASHVYEPGLREEIGAFVCALVKSRTRGPEPRVTVFLLRENDVVVNADALLRLQSKATVLGWITDNPQVFACILNNSDVPPDVAFKMGELTGDWIKEKKERQ
jgi:hypothetical protein